MKDTIEHEYNYNYNILNLTDTVKTSSVCEYHFVWVPKYRYQVLVKDLNPRLKEILMGAMSLSGHIRKYLKEQVEDQIRQEQLSLWRDDSLKGALGAVMQTFDGKEVYPSIEEKGANLLTF